MSLVKSASAEWDGDLRFDVQSGSGHSLRLDGEGNLTGFSPMELVLVGLAGCTGMDVISILKKKRQKVTGLSIGVTGTQQEEHPKVYQSIQVEFVVRGHAIDPQAVDRAIILSQNKYCPVSAMFGGAPLIHCTYRIEAASAA